MIVQFSVENFLSIKERQVFSMLASSDKTISGNLLEGVKANENYLKSAVIYGANASGKSNIIKAINVVIMMLNNSNNMQPGQKLPIVPFRLDPEYINKPSSFEFILVIDGIKYAYGFKADENKVYEEYLYSYPNKKETKIFERTNVDEYDFTLSEKSLKDLATKNLENKFFLATATTWNYEKTKPVFDYLTRRIGVLFDYNQLRGFSFDAYKNDTTGRLKEFSINLLNEADININDFEVNDKEMTETDLAMIPPEIRGLIPKSIRGFQVTTSHSVENENGKSESVTFNFEDESLGTQNIFILNPILMNVLENGNTLFVDELDKSLHPFLVKYIIKIFNSEEYNKKGAQLIFNTHDTNLLSLNLFRRDQIWFTEKDYKKGATVLYPLDDFPVRKTENVEKGYLNGRYGAIPFVAFGDELWPEK